MLAILKAKIHLSRNQIIERLPHKTPYQTPQAEMAHKFPALGFGAMGLSCKFPYCRHIEPRDIRQKLMSPLSIAFYGVPAPTRRGAL